MKSENRGKMWISLMKDLIHVVLNQTKLIYLYMADSSYMLRKSLDKLYRHHVRLEKIDN